MQLPSGKSLIGGGLRGALVIGSVIRLVNWVAEKPAGRSLACGFQYQPSSDPTEPPEAVFTLRLEEDGKTIREFRGTTVDEPVMQATVWVSKS